MIAAQRAHRRLSLQHEAVQRQYAERAANEESRIEKRARRLSLDYINQEIERNAQLASMVTSPTQAEAEAGYPKRPMPTPPAAASRRSSKGVERRSGWGALIDGME